MAFHVSVVAVAVAAVACHAAVVVSLFAVVYLVDVAYLVDFPSPDFVVSLAAVAFLVAGLLPVVVSHAEAVGVQV